MPARVHCWCTAFLLLCSCSAASATVGAAIDDHEFSDSVIAANASAYTQANNASPPLQGWSLEGGRAQTVALFNEHSNSTLSTLRYATMCADHCVRKADCIAWSFGPQAALKAVAAHDVNCVAGDTAKQCRCVLHAAAAGNLAASKKHAIVGFTPAPDDSSITYSGVVQRNVTIYSGRPPDAVQPHRILLVVNFHHHFTKSTVDFITQRLYPLCLPAGIDVVMIGPQSGVSGALLHPWTHRGHFSALSLALAYWRFPSYDGYLLQNDDFLFQYWNTNVTQKVDTKILATFPLSETPSRLKYLNTAQRASWSWWERYYNNTKAALADLHKNHSKLIQPQSSFANTADGYRIGKADGNMSSSYISIHTMQFLRSCILRKVARCY
jgi:hypothetical protein